MRFVLAGLGILSLALLSSSRVTVWQTDRSVWSDAQQKAPFKPRPAVNLAADAIARGDLVLADQWLDRADLIASDRASGEVRKTHELVVADRAIVQIYQFGFATEQ